MDWIKDTAQVGLYKRIRDTGDVWAVKSRVKGGKPITYTIGKVSLFTLAKARAETRRILALLAQGINPIETRRSQAIAEAARNLTLEKAITDYTESSSWKPKTKLDATATLKRRFSDWYPRRLSSITKDECRARFLKIKADVRKVKERRDALRTSSGRAIKRYRNEIGLGEAQRAFRYLSAMFNSYTQDDAGEERLLPKGNPCLILKVKRLRRTLRPRETFLEYEQRVLLYETLSNASHPEYRGTIKRDDADLIWLLIHTGLRLDEARTMKWSTIDLDREVFTAIDTKNHRDHTLPMTAATKGMFARRSLARVDNNEYLFPSSVDSSRPMTASRTFERICKEINCEFTAHDLRRTVATVASELGYDLNTIGAVLNHSVGGVTSGYVQHTYTRLKDILEDIQNKLFAEPYDTEAPAIEREEESLLEDENPAEAPL